MGSGFRVDIPKIDVKGKEDLSHLMKDLQINDKLRAGKLFKRQAFPRRSGITQHAQLAIDENGIVCKVATALSGRAICRRDPKKPDYTFSSDFMVCLVVNRMRICTAYIQNPGQ